jgi:putative nucleotidyltransferase with HDIG domain
MSRQVLVVQEDSKSIETLSYIFKSQGDRVSIATTLRDAGREVERNKPDIVVMDVHLFGKKWHTSIPKLESRLPNTKLIFTSSNVPEEGQDGDERYEEWGIVCSPFTAYQIDRTLRAPRVEASVIPTGNRADTPSARVRSPIRLKITFQSLLISILIAVVAGYLVTRIVSDTMQHQFSNQLIDTRTLASEWMVKQEGRYLEMLRLVSHTQGVAEAVEAKDSETLRRLVFPLVVNAQGGAVEILDSEGISLLSIRQQTGGQPNEYAVSRGDEGYRHWTFVSNVLEGREDSLGGQFAGIVKAPWGEYLYTAGPILNDEGSLIGVILTGESLAVLVEQIQDATLAQVTFYGLEGEILASTFSLALPSIQPLMVSDILARQDTASYQRSFFMADMDYEELLGPLEIRWGKDVGLIGISMSPTFFVRSSNTTRLQILVSVLMVLLVVIGAGALLANRITRRINRLKVAASEVALGNLDVWVGSGGGDEVESLASTFNSMVSAVKQSNQDLIEAYDLTIRSWATAQELRGQESAGHTKRVTELTFELARSIGLSAEELAHVRRGAMLHDIGKMAISDSILNKVDKLTEAEWAAIRKHPVYAHQILSQIPFLQPALDIPCCHHERWDGSGYPYGMKGDEIPLVARIFAVIDAWDALTSDRPYRPAWPKAKVVSYIRSARGSHFDPWVVDRFLDLIGETDSERLDEPQAVERPSASYQADFGEVQTPKSQRIA